MFRAFLEEGKNRKAYFAKSEKSAARPPDKTGKGPPILPWPPTTGSVPPMSSHKVPVFRPALTSTGVVTIAWSSAPIGSIGDGSAQAGKSWQEMGPERLHNFRDISYDISNDFITLSIIRARAPKKPVAKLLRRARPKNGAPPEERDRRRSPIQGEATFTAYYGTINAAQLNTKT